MLPASIWQLLASALLASSEWGSEGCVADSRCNLMGRSRGGDVFTVQKQWTVSQLCNLKFSGSYSKKNKSKDAVEINFNRIFYLAKYLQNPIISSCDHYKN